MKCNSKYFRIRVLLFGSLECVLAVGLFIGVSSSADCAALGPHAGVVTCGTCHTVGAAATEINAGSLTAPQGKLCAGCHTNATHASHPTAFTPARPLPVAFPLDREGQLNCTTCHEVHAGPAQRPARLPSRQLCLGCHQPGFFERTPDHGLSLFGFGHLAVGRDAASVALDPFSHQCLTCHMEHGSLVSAALFNSPSVARKGGHPIGGNYVKAASYGGYRPRESLPMQMLLPGGRIACVSCHEGYSERHGALLVANSHSGLCSRCHSL